MRSEGAARARRGRGASAAHTLRILSLERLAEDALRGWWWQDDGHSFSAFAQAELFKSIDPKPPEEKRQEVFFAGIPGRFLYLFSVHSLVYGRVATKLIFVSYSLFVLPAPSPRSTAPSPRSSPVSLWDFVEIISCLRAHCSGEGFLGYHCV